MLQNLNGATPTELSQIGSLQGMYLHGNNFTSSIPSELGLLSNMTWLSLGGSLLDGLIPQRWDG